MYTYIVRGTSRHVDTPIYRAVTTFENLCRTMEVLRYFYWNVDIVTIHETTHLEF
jgi:hypothetical protein